MSVNIKIDKFRNYEKIDIELSDFLIFCGENGSGKTQMIKILDTIDSYIRNRGFRFTTDEIENPGMYQKITGIESPLMEIEKK